MADGAVRSNPVNDLHCPEHRDRKADRTSAAGRSVPMSMPAQRARTLQLTALGCIALVLGLLVYAADRNPSSALLFPAAAVIAGGPLFGAAGSWLPSLVHPFAFSLFSAAAIANPTRPAYGACAAWWVVNVGFEFAQHERFGPAIAQALHRIFGPVAPADALASYLLRGTFDRADIVAASLGSLAAAAVLALLHRRTGRGHEA